jgi:hypothetical protein
LEPPTEVMHSLNNLLLETLREILVNSSGKEEV